jgi:general stress protein 26
MNKHQSDPDAKNLTQDAAVEKIRQLAKAARVCLLGTSEGHLPLEVRPMTVQDVDAAGNLWFLSARSSFQNHQISRHPQAQLLFANPGSSEFLSLQGRAFVTDSRPLKEKYWNPLATGWFPGGIDDPELTVLRFQTESGHYWDTEYGKTVTLLSVVAGALTGKPLSSGVQGNLKP